MLTFNKYAAKMLGNPDAVKLMFEKKESLIGVVASSMKDKDAFPLKPKSGGMNWVVSSKAATNKWQVSDS